MELSPTTTMLRFNPPRRPVTLVNSGSASPDAGTHRLPLHHPTSNIAFRVTIAAASPTLIPRTVRKDTLEFTKARGGRRRSHKSVRSGAARDRRARCSRRAHASSPAGAATRGMKCVRFHSRERDIGSATVACAGGGAPGGLAAPPARRPGRCEASRDDAARK